MKQSKSNTTSKRGRFVLFALLTALFIVIVGLAAVGIFGTSEQFRRTKE